MPRRKKSTTDSIQSNLDSLFANIEQFISDNYQISRESKIITQNLRNAQAWATRLTPLPVEPKIENTVEKDTETEDE